LKGYQLFIESLGISTFNVANRYIDKYAFISENNMKRFLLVTLMLTGISAFAGDLPDPKLTPGVINPNVTQENIKDTICKDGWTKTIRPSASYTNKLKLKQMAALNLTGKASDYEEDHLISLELGGHPTNPQNLWPQLWNGDWGAHKKDVIETRLKTLVCAGQVTLADAQHDVATDWVAAYQKYVPVKKSH
jgi:hypothetical protein